MFVGLCEKHPPFVGVTNLQQHWYSKAQIILSRVRQGMALKCFGLQFHITLIAITVLLVTLHCKSLDGA